MAKIAVPLSVSVLEIRKRQMHGLSCGSEKAIDQDKQIVLAPKKCKKINCEHSQLSEVLLAAIFKN